jgi:hypothetical protein
MRSITIPVENALEARRRYLHEKIGEESAEIVKRTNGVPGMMLERLRALTLEAGALDQVCSEYDITSKVAARGLIT